MAKVTVAELFCGDKYGIAGEVIRGIYSHQEDFVKYPNQFRELGIVRQTLIAVEKMKKNGDSIVEGELRDVVATFYKGCAVNIVKELRECRAFAERNGIDIIDCYIDRAMSTKTDNRPEFQRVIKDSGIKSFDVVLVWNLDRFARDRYDSAYYKRTLSKKRRQVNVYHRNHFGWCRRHIT